MTRTSPSQVAFSSGELDPLLHRRSDYQRFQTGLARCVGFLPLAQGGFTRTPGTFFKGYTRGNASAVLVPFQFAADDALILEFTPGWMRVWRYGNLVMAGASPYQLATPFDAAAIAALRWVQSADVIYLCDGIHPVQRLSRFALDNWTIAPQVYTTGPFRVQNDNKALTVRASAATGAITLTASGSLFQANHIGSLIQLAPTDNTTVALFTTNEAVTVGQRRRNDGNVYELTMRTGSDVGENAPVHTEGEALTDNDTKWKFICDSTGVARITAVASGTSASATVLKTIPPGCVDDPTYRWSEGAWSDRYGYPSAIEIYDQRLVAAATPSEPRSLWFSTVGDYVDFTPGTEADEAFAYTISGQGSINRIINLRRGRGGLHILALGEEYSTRSESRAQVIGPTTAVFGLDGAIGSSAALPIAPAGDPIFISRDERRVIMVAYSLQEDSNRNRILSRTAQHLGADGFKQLVWQGTPEPTAWARLGNGDMAAMVFDAAEDVLGWSRQPVAGGFVEGMAVSPSADGSSDVLTLIVRREINGATVRCIEEQAFTFGSLTGEQSIFDACHLFCAKTFAGPGPQTDFAVPHLIGQAVEVWADTGAYGPLTVPASGILTLPYAATQAIIGLFDATHFAETLDVQAAAPDGSSTGRQKRLYSGIAIGLHRTAQGQLQTVERTLGKPDVVGVARNLINRPVLSPYGEAYSGVVSISAPTGHATELAIRIRPISSAPLTITAIVPTVQEGGR